MRQNVEQEFERGILCVAAVMKENMLLEVYVAVARVEIAEQLKASEEAKRISMPAIMCVQHELALQENCRVGVCR